MICFVRWHTASGTIALGALVGWSGSTDFGIVKFGTSFIRVRREQLIFDRWP